MNPQTYLFYGKSGAGKGTQAKLLQEYLIKNGHKVLYIETGAEFRKFIEHDNYTAKMVKEKMDKGELINDFLPIWLWGDFFVKNFSGGETLILDGLCRRPHEAPILDSAFKFYNRKNVNVINVGVSNEWATERLLGRGRGDDKVEEIKKRLDWFEWNVIPAMSFFHDNTEYNFLNINGEQSIEEVHNEIMQKLGF